MVEVLILKTSYSIFYYMFHFNLSAEKSSRKTAKGSQPVLRLYKKNIKKDVVKTEKKPTLTKTIMGLCFVIYFAELYLGYTQGDGIIKIIFETYGFTLDSFLAGNYWNIITSMFLHAGPEHIILNMIALFFFGRAVETELGWKKFLFIFLITGIAGNLVVAGAGALGLMPASIPTVGASAAIFGLMGAAMFVKPFDLILYPYLVPVPLIMVAVLYTLYNLGAFAAVLVMGEETDIAYVAHLGGLIAGAYLGIKEEGIKKSLLIIFLIFAVLLAIPFFIELIQYLELFNYGPSLSQVFSGG